MLNGALKNDAIERVEKSEKKFNKNAKTVNNLSLDLLKLRKVSSESTITAVEGYINTLANTPKEFDKSFSEYKNNFATFNEVLAEIQEKDASNDVAAKGSLGTGVGTGVAVAAFAPTAAMAAATTFGVASTGTAISALSGAAATNAALAWLGGGALAAGGGGMTAGTGLLALAGPIGWGIAGVAAIGTGLWKRSKNAEIAEKADGINKELLKGITELKTAKQEVKKLLELTKEHSDSAKSLLAALKSDTPNDYSAFSDSQKGHLLALVNNIQSLASLLNKKAI